MLRQRFWRQYLKQYDTDDTSTISHVEMTSMLDSLGSTLSASTVDSFFTRFGKDPQRDDLTTEEAIRCLETEVLRPESLARLTELSRYVYELANMNFRSSQPFVGQSAFAHKGGMHVHAVARAASSYEHMQPELVGNERRFLVSELSGRSNIMALTAKHHLEDDRELPRGRADLSV